MSRAPGSGRGLAVASILVTVIEGAKRQSVARVEPKSSGHESIRRDIEGLRAIAVGVVLLYHAGAPFLPGGFVGVDVFFVISGFLITTLLVKEMLKTGSISLPAFYARRAKRILPAAAAVLVVVVLATRLFLPKTRWLNTSWDVVASSLYGINWRLASQSTDYMAQGDAKSPVLHFWSLAVEEQFYLIWPLLLLVVTLWARPRLRGKRTFLRGRDKAGKRDPTLALGIGLAVLALPSLAWSVHLTATDSGPAYFVTTTRMWELAIGAGCAVFAHRLRHLPRATAVVLGWLGLAAVIGTALILTNAIPFPGIVALIPTLGAAAVIASGPAAGKAGPVAILGLKPMLWIGALSYSLYLWHWPLIVIASAKLSDHLTLGQGLVVVALSFLPAWLSYRYVENPARHSALLTRNPMLALKMGLACTLVGVLAALGLILAIWPPHSGPARLSQYVPLGLRKEAPAEVQKFGAMVLSSDPRNDPKGEPVDKVASITPNPLDAANDFTNDCPVTGVSETVVRSCNYGNASSKTHVLLLGDSHAEQWIPAVSAIAEAKGWSLTVHIKSSCPFIQGEVSANGRPYPQCAVWNREVRAQIAREPSPDLVILTNLSPRMVQGSQILSGRANYIKAAASLRAAWTEFTDKKISIAVIRDSPFPGRNIPDCVAANPDHLSRCAVPRSTALQGADQMAAIQGLKGAHLIDLTDAICPADRCAPVIGGVLLWKDHNHLTRTYVQSLTPRLESELAPLVQ